MASNKEEGTSLLVCRALVQAAQELGASKLGKAASHAHLHMGPLAHKLHAYEKRKDELGKALQSRGGCKMAPWLSQVLPAGEFVIEQQANGTCLVRISSAALQHYSSPLQPHQHIPAESNAPSAKEKASRVKQDQTSKATKQQKNKSTKAQTSTDEPSMPSDIHSSEAKSVQVCICLRCQVGCMHRDVYSACHRQHLHATTKDGGNMLAPLPNSWCVIALLLHA